MSSAGNTNPILGGGISPGFQGEAGVAGGAPFDGDPDLIGGRGVNLVGSYPDISDRFTDGSGGGSTVERVDAAAVLDGIVGDGDVALATDRPQGGRAATAEAEDRVDAAADEVAVRVGTSIAEAVSLELAHEQDGSDRSGEVFRLKRDPETYKVSVESDLTLEDYKNITNPEDWALMESLAEGMKGRSVVFVNPTMEGGGVAMLRPTVVDMLTKLGVEAHWFVMAKGQDPGQDPFKVTKLMHNISQRQAGEARLTDEGKAVHHKWAVEENGPVLLAQPEIQDASIIVVDDPQPAPLIPHFKELNPDAKIVWRNHIDTNNELMSDPTTPQGEVANYLLNECGVATADAVVAHPVEDFIHPGMDAKTYFAPATIDPFDNLNRHLSPEEISGGVDFINNEIAKKNEELVAAGRGDEAISLLDTDPSRKRVTLIARFDESKGMDIAMEMGYNLRKELREQGVPEHELPEVVIVGNGSVDDPSGVPMFEAMMKLRKEQFADDMDGIILMRLKHNYDAMNALTQRTSILMQTSRAEGLETRVSDAINHETPAVVSNRGGIKTQIIEGKSGIVLDFGRDDYDMPRGVAFMKELLTDETKYAAFVASTAEAAAVHNRREFTTTANVIRFLEVFGDVLEGRPANKTWLISEKVAKRRAAAGGAGGAAVAGAMA